MLSPVDHCGATPLLSSAPADTYSVSPGKSIMIGTIRRHSQSLWWIIVAAVIVSFVWFYGASNSSMETLLEGRRGQSGSLYGTEIKPSLLQTSRRQVEFSHFLQDRNPQSRRSRSDEQMRTEIYQQVLLNHELAANQIVPGPEALGVALAEEFKGSSTTASPADIKQSYNNFLASLEKTSFTEADFVTLLRSQVALGHLRELMSVPAALITPREASEEFRRENETLQVSAVLFPSSNYLSSVVISPETIGRYYSNNLARYYSEERISLNYARFDASNHLAAAEAELVKNPNLTTQLEQVYAQRTNQNATAFVDEEGRPLGHDAALTKLRGEVVLNGALQRAYKQAVEFYNGLGKKKVTAETFIAYATNATSASAGLSIGTTPASSPASLAFLPPFAGSQEASEALSRIGPTAPFTTPIVGKEGVTIAAFRERIPSAVQPLDTIRARVESDYRRQETMNAARAAARAFFSQVTNGIAAGKSFADLAQQQGFKVEELPAFSRAMNQVEGLPAGVNLFELKNAFNTAKAGDVQLLDQGGTPLLVSLKERKPVAEETVKAGVNAYMEEIRQRRQNGVFGEWFRQKMEDSGVSALLNPPAAAGSPEPTRPQ